MKEKHNSQCSSMLFPGITVGGFQMSEAPNIDIVQYLLHVLNCHIRIS